MKLNFVFTCSLLLTWYGINALPLGNVASAFDSIKKKATDAVTSPSENAADTSDQAAEAGAPLAENARSVNPLSSLAGVAVNAAQKVALNAMGQKLSSTKTEDVIKPTNVAPLNTQLALDMLEKALHYLETVKDSYTVASVGIDNQSNSQPTNADDTQLNERASNVISALTQAISELKLMIQLETTVAVSRRLSSDEVDNDADSDSSGEQNKDDEEQNDSSDGDSDDAGDTEEERRRLAKESETEINFGSVYETEQFI